MVKIENQNMLGWQFTQLEEIVTAGDLKKIELKKFETLLLKQLPKNPEAAGDFIPRLEGLAIKLYRGFNKISVSETSVRDDIICVIVIIYSIIGEDRKAAALIHDVEKQNIPGLNYKFVLAKLFNYKEAGDKLAKKNKIWSSLLRAYKHGEISAIKGKSAKVNAMMVEVERKSVIGKLKDIFGI